MDVRLIGVPYMAGDGTHPAAKGPQRYLLAGVEQLLAGKGVAVTWHRVDLPQGATFREASAASTAVNRRLRPAVWRATSAGQLPIVLAGSCDASIGVLSGLRAARRGIVWIDAHGDFNTPESSTTGFFPGMSLAIATGHCYQELWTSLGDNRPVPEEATVLIGVRSLSPAAEARRLRRSAIRVVPWRDGRPQGDVATALDQLVNRVDGVYLHIDNDAFDPGTAAGVVDEPVPGGLSLSDMEAVIGAVTSRFVIHAVTVATYTPDNDRDDRTLRADLRLLELLGDYAAGRR